MAFTRPTLTDLVSRISSDFSSRLLSGATVLRRSIVYVLSRVIAGAVHLNYGYLDWIAKQAMPDTADSENLARWASIWGVTRKPAGFAKGNVTFAGTNGVVIPIGTEIQRTDGALFTTDVEVTIAAGTATVAVTALEGGTGGNTDAATIVALTSPIAGIVASPVVAAGGLAGGTETESDDDLRARLLGRIQEPPHGGSANDYVAWALEIAGVTRAWAYANWLGAGTVGVTFVMDDQVGTIIPGGGKVTEVQNYINDASRKPVTADVTVFAPVAVALNFTITAIAPNTQAVKDAITAELKDLIRREAEPGGTLLVSHIREAISKAQGETDHILTLPAGNVVSAAGQITTMGVITWA